MRISDWSSDVCSSDLTLENAGGRWGVAEKSGYPADFEKVRATLLSVSQMETVEPRTAKPELLPKLELSDVDAPESKSIRVTAQVGEEILADAIIGRWQDEGRDKGLGSEERRVGKESVRRVGSRGEAEQ